MRRGICAGRICDFATNGTMGICIGLRTAPVKNGVMQVLPALGFSRIPIRRRSRRRPRRSRGSEASARRSSPGVQQPILFLSTVTKWAAQLEPASTLPGSIRASKSNECSPFP